MEEWRDVVGYEGLYQVSNLGNVRSLDRIITYATSGQTRQYRGQLLSPGKTGDRLTVSLGNGTAKSFYVHDLVLIAFKGPCPEGMEGCHNDGNGTFNDVTNLRWDTRSENTYDRVRHGTHHAKNKERCPFDHLLQMPNLVRKPWEERQHRQCLTCNRTSAAKSIALKHDRSFDFEYEANWRYKKIMGLDVVS